MVYREKKQMAGVYLLFQVHVAGKMQKILIFNLCKIKCNYFETKTKKKNIQLCNYFKNMLKKFKKIICIYLFFFRKAVLTLEEFLRRNDN